MTTRATAFGLLFAAAALAAGCGSAAAPAPETTPTGSRAEATLEARAGSGLSGTAVFESDGSGKVVLRIAIEGATPGLHAAHIHEHGDCAAPDASSAGGHWNPTNKNHGKWGQEDGQFHLGDLGNIEVGADGRGVLALDCDQWEIGGGGPRDVVGKSIIVHAKPDDFTTQPTGAAGDRIGCGAIRQTR